MKKLLLLSCFISLTGLAYSQASFGLGATYLDDLGVQARASLKAGDNLGLIPQVSYFFVDGATRLSVDVNLSYDVAVILEEIPVYLLGGLDWTRISVDGSNFSDSNLGFNLGGGTRLGSIYGEVFYRKLFCDSCGSDVGFNLGYMF